MFAEGKRIPKTLFGGKLDMNDKIENFLLKLLNEIYFVFDDNNGSREIIVGDIILNDENEEIIVRLHNKEV